MTQWFSPRRTFVLEAGPFEQSSRHVVEERRRDSPATGVRRERFDATTIRRSDQSERAVQCGFWDAASPVVAVNEDARRQTVPS